MYSGIYSVYFKNPHNLRTGYTYRGTDAMTRRMLSEAEGYALLKNQGIPVPEFSVVRTRQEVANAADQTGIPAGYEGHLSPDNP